MKHRGAGGTVRIIAGRWRRRVLPVGVSAGLRPTPDRVRETLFNWLRDGTDGARCLDLFAGTGALGFEAASRGAAKVTLIERDPTVAAMLEDAAGALGATGVEVVRADALAWTPPPGEKLDVVFIDPPRAGPAPEAALARLVHLDVLAPGCLVYLETDRDAGAVELPPGWRFLQARRAGRVRYHLASRDPPAGPR